jgi:hypothetical protein
MGGELAPSNRRIAVFILCALRLDCKRALIYVSEYAEYAVCWLQMLTVFTIGHSTRTWEAFLSVLRAHGVERVIDVRTIPRSRHNPQFNREILAAKLRGARIGYVHLGRLGGLRHARRDSENMGWRNASFRGFADYMQTKDFEKGLQRLIYLAKQKKSALMCAEAVPWRCHRSLIADALVVRKIRVAHIVSGTRSQPHALTSFGRVQGTRITYPASAAHEKPNSARQTKKFPRQRLSQGGAGPE